MRSALRVSQDYLRNFRGARTNQNLDFAVATLEPDLPIASIRLVGSGILSQLAKRLVARQIFAAIWKQAVDRVEPDLIRQARGCTEVL